MSQNNSTQNSSSGIEGSTSSNGSLFSESSSKKRKVSSPNTEREEALLKVTALSTSIYLRCINQPVKTTEDADKIIAEVDLSFKKIDTSRDLIKNTIESLEADFGTTAKLPESPSKKKKSPTRSPIKPEFDSNESWPESLQKLRKAVDNYFHANQNYIFKATNRASLKKLKIAKSECESTMNILQQIKKEFVSERNAQLPQDGSADPNDTSTSDVTVDDENAAKNSSPRPTNDGQTDTDSRTSETSPPSVHVNDENAAENSSPHQTADGSIDFETDTSGKAANLVEGTGCNDEVNTSGGSAESESTVSTNHSSNSGNSTRKNFKAFVDLL